MRCRIHATCRPAPDLPRAFTLVELVVVLATLGILASVAVPRISRSLSHHRVVMATHRTMADLALAAWHAQERSVAVDMEFDLANGSYTLFNVPDLETSNPDYVVSLSAEPYGTTILSASFGGDANVSFDMYGNADSDGTVVLGSGGWQRQVSLDAASGAVTSP